MDNDCIAWRARQCPSCTRTPRHEKDFKVVSQVLLDSNHNNMYVGRYNLVSEAYDIYMLADSGM